MKQNPYAVQERSLREETLEEMCARIRILCTCGHPSWVHRADFWPKDCKEPDCPCLLYHPI